MPSGLSWRNQARRSGSQDLLLLPLASGVLRVSGVLRARGLPGRSAVWRSNAASPACKGFLLPRKLAAEKDWCWICGATAIREDVCCLPNVNPLRHVDVSLGRGGWSRISIVNVAVNSDVISDPTSIGTRDTSADIAVSDSPGDRTILKPGQWTRKHVPRPTDSGPLTTRTPPSAARSRANCEALLPKRATRRLSRPPDRSRIENGRPAMFIGGARSVGPII
jgi:hypothetical protein